MGLNRYEATLLSGRKVNLSQYEGNVILVVNTASKCGLAKQFKELETLYQDYKSEGFIILGFPSDQFNNQEHDNNAAIQEACEINYGVTFPMFQKVNVNGPKAHPLFKWLKSQKSGLMGTKIKWNFTKFLIDRDGNVIKRFAPMKKPDKMRIPIAKTLG